MKANIKFFKTNVNAVTPTRGSEDAAGYDLYACVDDYVIIEPHQTVKINTGLCMALPSGYFGAIFARSGLATKQNLRPANCVGVVDADYRGEVCVALHNDSEKGKIIHHGERIAQLVLMEYNTMDFEEVSTLEELGVTDRGNGGFGSTGK